MGKILVGIAARLLLNFIRIFGGNRFQPSMGGFEFVRSVHEPDCTMRWDNGVITNVSFYTEYDLSVIFVVFKIQIYDTDTTLGLYRHELTALAGVARDVPAAIDGDWTRLSDFGRLFDRRLGGPWLVHVKVPCCQGRGPRCCLGRVNSLAARDESLTLEAGDIAANASAFRHLTPNYP